MIAVLTYYYVNKYFIAFTFMELYRVGLLCICFRKAVYADRGFVLAGFGLERMGGW